MLFERIGATVSISRVEEHTSAGCFGENAREVLPVRNRAESFVKQHDRRDSSVTRLNSDRFEPVAVDQVTAWDGNLLLNGR